uniref:calmodulin-binding protein 60 D-like n=1 Tax=Erigeron canadensis TaxID=72917 RepID=UPI001CB89AB3|nr:calmodulin-binding protein 60 D-like [Erigeron canadensis]
MDNYYHQNPQDLDYEASASSRPIDLKLMFSSEIASPVFTKDTIAGGDGGNESIKVYLVDSNTLEKVTTGSIASTKVKIVLLHGDGLITTSLEFKENIVVDHGKKKNLLLGNCYVDLENGCGTVGRIRIKHDRNPISNVTFRLGAMVVDSRYAVKEAITKPFQVKDRRNLPKCSGPRSLEDSVGELINISKKGKIRDRLESENIFTVRNFIDMYFSDATKLQKICRIKGKKWDMTIKHAKTSLFENVCNACEQVGSTSQEWENLPSFDYDDSVLFDDNCYKPRLCEDDEFVMDSDFSTKDVEMGDIYLYGRDKEKGVNIGELVFVHNAGIGKGFQAKKSRWVKLRTIWLLIRSFMKSCTD